MKEIYVSPQTEIIELIERYGVLDDELSAGVADGGDSLGKENMSWDDSEAPIFEAHHNKLWDE